MSSKKPVIVEGNKDNDYTSRVEVVVSGPWASFRVPAFKSEGMTYPCITCSAARGLLEAIYWHPQFFYSIVRIEVLKPINTQAMVFNEPNFYKRDSNVLRTYVLLTDVSYHIVADINIKKGVEIGIECNALKYRNIFNERVRKGQCYKTPCLGLSEFRASFESYDKAIHKPCNVNFFIGDMLCEMEYTKKEVIPHFLHEASIKNGILTNGEEALEAAYRREISYRSEEIYHE